MPDRRTPACRSRRADGADVSSCLHPCQGSTHGGAIRPIHLGVEAPTLRGMIVHDFIAVELPARDVRQALLAESATAACAQGNDLLVRVGPSGSGARLSKTVAVKIGRPIIQGEVISLPLLWEAVGTPALFPRVDASLEVAPLAPTLTQLSFFGRSLGAESGPAALAQTGRAHHSSFPFGCGAPAPRRAGGRRAAGRTGASGWAAP